MFGVKFEGNLMSGAINQLVGESPMDPYYRNTHLKLLGTSSPLFFRYFGMNKKGVFLSFLS